MKDTYKTISSSARGEHKDRGSKFIAFAYPVGSESTAKEIITDIKKQYHDARHHCYAYKIGIENDISRSYDDGEPSGTAGKPIYGQILSFGITNVLIVVVRYFGGRLLGTGGLIRAYRGATENALNHAEIIEKTIDHIVEINFGYENQGEINNVLKAYECKVIKQCFDEKCHLSIQIRKSQSEAFIKRISAFKNMDYKLNKDL
ncbi:MAG: YigZ family protein [Bacteroidales bacterium]|nr:YigZ family protein [Bacteroidales bacterium]